MSLLLDALKRAEQEKLAKQGEQRPLPEKARAIAATPANEPSNASLELAPIGPAAEPPPAASAGVRGDAAAAKNVFQAKEGQPAERSRKGILLWIGLAALVAIVAAAGIYVWMSVNSFTPRTVASSRPRPAPLPISPSPQSTPPNLEVLMAPPQQPSAAIQPPPAPPTEAAKPAAESARPDARTLAAELLREAPHATAPVKLAPSIEKTRVSAEVSAGYEALRNGDLGAARGSYATAVANDPANVDARLGAATVEARLGNRMLAAMHYRKAIEADPRNATALAGLASIGDFAQPDGLEAKLRGDISRSPESPQLHFAMGNLYASQRRWPEAQSEYFEAHRLDPANPDILFNFSVALDHIGQTRLAADYYRRTLDAARGQATQFDPAAVQRRLAELR